MILDRPRKDYVPGDGLAQRRGERGEDWIECLAGQMPQDGEAVMTKIVASPPAVPFKEPQGGKETWCVRELRWTNEGWVTLVGTEVYWDPTHWQRKKEE